ncbi:UPF0223 family protein [Salinicoccus sp. ID82-1]|uniref:UPF0223 family protein n=1 Tax=Salinicoccus sp. ID82-1 TaxID=2820269 RepID=UPI001F4823ED|nr:UPF0223 family protein [Salinicoccus sp. ID82-1]MCG1008587.1 UPF0223 family protein [Salinicoccus sp. ID82-1]
MEEYSYPIDVDWTTEEIIDVVDFFEAIEKADEKGIIASELKDKYRKFKVVVPGKAQEKALFKEFKENSDLEAYSAVKMLKDADDSDVIKI